LKTAFGKAKGARRVGTPIGSIIKQLSKEML
jgi:hypothetical protein